jgi:hypothetical protein
MKAGNTGPGEGHSCAWDPRGKIRAAEDALLHEIDSVKGRRTQWKSEIISVLVIGP